MAGFEHEARSWLLMSMKGDGRLHGAENREKLQTVACKGVVEIEIDNVQYPSNEMDLHHASKTGRRLQK